jgi:hypothetical protein
VTSKGALGVCATLERRAAALSWSALASARRCDDQRSAEIHRAAATRRLLFGCSLWRADACAIAHARDVRAEKIAGALLGRAGRALLEAEAHAVERRRWAQLRRGLELRATRVAARRPQWPD